MQPHCVFITGATGYLAAPLVPALRQRGHRVRGLARRQSALRLPAGADPVIADPLQAESYAGAIAPADTLVHLVGTPRPNPAKAASFRSVDLASVEAAVKAAKSAGVRHFVYVSVAQPAPVMKAYVESRQAGEALVRDSGIPATILRPWYVLGPGHRWPCLLLPVYAVLKRIPATREPASRLALVSLAQMVKALVSCVEQPAPGLRIVEVPEIRRSMPLMYPAF